MNKIASASQFLEEDYDLKLSHARIRQMENLLHLQILCSGHLANVEIKQWFFYFESVHRDFCIHDVQILLTGFDSIVDRPENIHPAIRLEGSVHPQMVFFGSADASHRYLLMGLSRSNDKAVYF